MTKRPLKRKKTERPFDDATEMDRFFDEYMNGMEEALEDFFGEAFKAGGGMAGFAYGFRMTSGPDGKPVLEEFGTELSPAEEEHQAREAPAVTKAHLSESEPLTDVIEGEKDVRVLAELRGVKEEDIRIDAKADSVSINIDTETRKYHGELKMPCNVSTDDIKTSLKNGILEIILRKTT